MIIKKIKLNNIRSYVNEEINFSTGSLLLSGDIGSGKSTILHAIDFALFGLNPELSGASLLRNGANNGSVELNFEIDGKDVLIKRILKRGNSINQDAGLIVIDGNKRNATHVELKQSVLNLLNYPQELLTKSKSLIYRYTVYTPQEEMKQILLGKKEERLEILRRVFGIDKYKRLRDNASIFISEIKGKIKEFSGVILDLDVKNRELEEKKKELTKLNSEFSKINEEFKKADEAVKQKIKEFEDLELKSKVFDKIKRDVEICEINLKHVIEASEENSSKIKNLESDIKLHGEIKNIKEVNKIDIEKKSSEIKNVENFLIEIRNNLQELKTRKFDSENLINRVASLDICPVCKQNVDKNHKHNITDEEKTKIMRLEAEINSLEAKKRELEKQLENFRLEYEKLISERNEFELNKFKSENLESKKKELEHIIKFKNKLKKDLSDLNRIKIELNNNLNKFKDVNDRYKKAKEEIEELRESLKYVEVKREGFKTKIEDVNNEVGELSEEINRKRKIKNDIDHLKKLQFWLENHFISLMSLIEKKVMLKLHNDFNSIFQRWFSMLIDAELIKVKLDEEFTPVIIQNGHEIDYNYLSGGEKTAVALAYRLALNEVINNIMSVIKTRDLLILDEPTDGFSSEQLDRLRNVLDELKTKQVILVSHENKIESFVQHVIRIDKREHVSRVL